MFRSKYGLFVGNSVNCVLRFRFINPSDIEEFIAMSKCRSNAALSISFLHYVECKMSVN